MSQQGVAQVVRGLPQFSDPNLLVGAEHFSDAGVYRLGDRLAIVQTLDFFPPLVDDPYVFGQIAAANSLSDVYAMGARPVTAMNIVGFPDDKLELGILQEILRGGAERVQAAGAVLVGGHTVRDAEIKYGLSVTGVVDPARMLTNAGAQPGDVLVLTKAVGTGFVTTAYKRGCCPPDVLSAACQSMVQLNAAASQAALDAGAHGMTDITGFGLGGHATELAQASGVTVTLQLDRIPILPGAYELAQQGNRNRAVKSNRAYAEPTTRIEGTPDLIRLDIVCDPQTSGGLLISIPAERALELTQKLRQTGATACCIVGSVEGRQEVSLVIR